MPEPPPSDGVLRALAHPARRTIVEHLARVPAEDAGHLAEVLWTVHRLAQPSTSKHLRRLVEAGVIHASAEAGAPGYALRRDVLAALGTWAAALAVPGVPDR